MKRTALLIAVALLELYICVALFPFHRQETYSGSKFNDALLLVALFLGVALAAIGAVCFVSPTTLQDYAAKQSGRHFRSNPFRNWMKTKERCWSSCSWDSFEIGLLEGFLPYKWQQEICHQSEPIFPSKKYEPHPDMGWEFELDYRQHPSHRIAMNR